jgi:hypothetical protein
MEIAGYIAQGSRGLLWLLLYLEKYDAKSSADSKDGNRYLRR